MVVDQRVRGVRGVLMPSNGTDAEYISATAKPPLRMSIDGGR